MKTTTKHICGRALRLVPGRRYVSSRPMASTPRQIFPVFIHDITDQAQHELVEVLECFSYDEADTFLAAFNNGRTSFEGRLW